MIKSHGGLPIGVPENRTALSAKPKNCSKSTRPSSIRRAGSGDETTALFDDAIIIMSMRSLYLLSVQASC